VAEDLNSLKEHYLRCVRCGQCRSVCPVFAEIGNETASPRGKVFLAHLLASGELKADAEVAQKLSLCLLCQACTKECPSAVPVHKIIMAARSMLDREMPSPLQKLVFNDIWTRPSLLNFSAGLLRGCQGLGLTGLGRSLGLLPPALDLTGRLPRRPAHSFIRELTKAEGKPKMRVGYFLGCTTNIIFPNIARSTVAVLSRLGCEVITPRDLKCCGLPQADNGLIDTADSLGLFNFAAFQHLGIDAVVTDCASCFSVLRESSVFKGMEILDLSQLLNDLLIGHKLEKTDRIITYHDPCHLAKAQGITVAPRELLDRTCAGFREMPGANNCCGGGGSFCFYNYDLSMGILDKKISSIKETGATVVATCCPSCIMQIRHGLLKSKQNITVAHPVELLAQTLGLTT
jgi:glycolate oxidase iron-sulfur subunit